MIDRNTSVKFGVGREVKELEVETEFLILPEEVTDHEEGGMGTEIEKTLYSGKSEGKCACLEAG